MQPSRRELLLLRLGTHDAAKAHVTGRGVDRLGEPGGGPVAAAVVRRAEVRAALEYFARNPNGGIGRIEAGFRPAGSRIVGNAAGLQRLGRVAWLVPVGGPLPHV